MGYIKPHSTSEALLETLSAGICSDKGWLAARQISFLPGLPLALGEG